MCLACISLQYETDPPYLDQVHINLHRSRPPSHTHICQMHVCTPYYEKCELAWSAWLPQVQNCKPQSQSYDILSPCGADAEGHSGPICKVLVLCAIVLAHTIVFILIFILVLILDAHFVR